MFPSIQGQLTPLHPCPPRAVVSQMNERGARTGVAPWVMGNGPGHTVLILGWSSFILGLMEWFRIKKKSLMNVVYT